MTKSAALEAAGFGVRVNVVAPDPTDTGMLTRFTGAPENKAALLAGVPMGRLGLSEELANAIVFIQSDEASFITGYILNVEFHQFRARRQSSVTTTTASAMAPTMQSRLTTSNVAMIPEVVMSLVSPLA